jgi:hypothetical protein
VFCIDSLYSITVQVSFLVAQLINQQKCLVCSNTYFGLMFLPVQFLCELQVAELTQVFKWLRCCCSGYFSKSILASMQLQTAFACYNFALSIFKMPTISKKKNIKFFRCQYCQFFRYPLLHSFSLHIYMYMTISIYTQRYWYSVLWILGSVWYYHSIRHIFGSAKPPRAVRLIVYVSLTYLLVPALFCFMETLLEAVQMN